MRQRESGEHTEWRRLPAASPKPLRSALRSAPGSHVETSRHNSKQPSPTTTESSEPSEPEEPRPSLRTPRASQHENRIRGAHRPFSPVAELGAGTATWLGTAPPRSRYRGRSIANAATTAPRIETLRNLTHNRYHLAARGERREIDAQ